MQKTAPYCHSKNKYLALGAAFLLIYCFMFCCETIASDTPQSQRSILIDSPAGAMTTLGGKVHLFRGQSSVELKERLMLLPANVLMMVFISSIPNYSTLFLGTLSQQFPQYQGGAKQLSKEIIMACHLHTLVSLSQSVFQYLKDKGMELLSTPSTILGQWYHWHQCDRHQGVYPVFLMQHSLAKTFMFEVETIQDNEPVLRILPLDAADEDTPYHWRRLRQSLHKHHIVSLNLQIYEENDQQWLKLIVVKRKGEITVRNIQLSSAQFPWDLQLMAHWCSHDHPGMHSVFSPAFVHQLARVIGRHDIHSLLAPPAVTESEQQLAQTSSASVLSLPGAESDTLLVWSDHAGISGHTGFLVLGAMDELPEVIAGFASTPDAYNFYSETSAQQLWFKETISAYELVLNSILASKARELNNKQLLSIGQQVKMAPIAGRTFSQQVSETATELFSGLHDEIMRGYKPSMFTELSLSPANLVRKVLPVHLLAPQYMISPDDNPRTLSSGSKADKQKSVKQPLTKKSSSSSQSGGDSSNRHPSKQPPPDGALKKSITSVISASSQASSSTDSTDGSPPLLHQQQLKMLKLTGFAHSDQEAIGNWLQTGLTDIDYPRGETLNALIKKTHQLVMRVSTEVEDALKALPSVVDGSELEAVDSLQGKSRIDVLAKSIGVIVGQSKNLLEESDASEDTTSKTLSQRWLSIIKICLAVLYELTTPPAASFREQLMPGIVFPNLESDPSAVMGSVGIVNTQILQLQVLIQAALQNPALFQFTFIDPRWFTLCAVYSQQCQKLINSVLSYQRSGDLFPVNAHLIPIDASRLMHQLVESRLFFNDRENQFLPAIPPPRFSNDPLASDMILINNILLGDQPVEWSVVCIPQLERIGNRLQQDLKSTSGMLGKIHNKVAKSPLPTLYKDQLLGKAKAAGAFLDNGNWAQDVSTTLEWLKHGHKTVHSQVITQKRKPGTKTDSNIQVDIYQPALARFADIYKDLILSCRNWRTGCPPVIELYPYYLTGHIQTIIQAERPHLTQYSKIIRRLQLDETLNMMGKLFGRYNGIFTVIQFNIESSMNLIEQLSSNIQPFTAPYHPIVLSALEIDNNLKLAYQELQTLGLPESEDELFNKLILDAMQFDSSIYPLMQKFIEGKISPEMLKILPKQQLKDMVSEVQRLNTLTLRYSQAILSQDQIYFLKWIDQILDNAIQQLDAGILDTSTNQHTMVSIPTPTPTLTKWNGTPPADIFSFVSDRYQEMCIIFPCLKPSDDTKLQETTSKQSLGLKQQLLAPKQQSPSSKQQRLTSQLKTNINLLQHQATYWGIVVEGVNRQGLPLSIHNPEKTQWLNNPSNTATQLPHEQYGLPFADELNKLWHSPTQAHTEPNFSESDINKLQSTPKLPTISTHDKPESDKTAQVSAGVDQSIQTPSNIDKATQTSDIRPGLDKAIQVSSGVDQSTQTSVALQSPVSVYHSRVEHAIKRSNSGANPNALLHMWTISIDTTLSEQTSKFGLIKFNPATDTAFQPPSSASKNNRFITQWDSPSEMLKERQHLWHFDRVSIANIAQTIKARCEKALSSLTSHSNSLYFYDTSGLNKVKASLQDAEKTLKEAQECWHHEIKTMMSLLDEAK